MSDGYVSITEQPLFVQIDEGSRQSRDFSHQIDRQSSNNNMHGHQAQSNGSHMNQIYA